jgi:hypothetical protein
LQTATAQTATAQTTTAQNARQFFLKGGTTVTRLSQTQWSSQGREIAIKSLLWGGGLGIEKQFSDNCTFSSTLEYLSKGSVPESNDIISDLEQLEKYNASQFITSIISVHSAVRFYSQNDLQGFFVGFGLDVSGIHSKNFLINRLANRYEIQDVKIRQDFAALPNLSLGTILPLNKNSAVEISSGIKIGANGVSLIPLIVQLKYSL